MKVEVPEIVVHEVEQCYHLLKNELKLPYQERSLELIEIYQKHIGEIMCGIIITASKERQSNNS